MTYPEHQISYTSEHGQEYSIGLSKCGTLYRMRQYLEHWLPFCADAYKIAWEMDAKAWKEFKIGRALEKSGKFAGNEWAEKYSAILMPEIIFRVSVTAANFQVPWGLAFIRLKEAGIIKEQDGLFAWVDPKEN